ncbi:MAG: TonB-linked SusC/RagA family outer membrane protein [Arcticibacterium sp.]|jgi:TonB-linked SusC/RagA family outer membrane protein
MINQLYQMSSSKLVQSVKFLPRLLALTLTLSIISFTSFSQNINVTGKVVDSNGDELPGVTVQVKGTSNGVSTDLSGNYSLSSVPSAGTIVYSFVGMTSQEIAVQSRSNINVTLANDEQLLEEVVVIGYGTVKKKDATGAVAAIGEKDFNKGVITSSEQLMQGRVAGVAITQSSGEPGGGINVRIRGTSSVRAGNGPLFVVDGVPLSGGDITGGGSNGGLGSSSARNPLNFLNPNDIASIDILKDASATAIYGSRGANGVVLITTKKGKQGKGSMDYTFSVGTSQITKKFDLLNASEFVAAGGPNNGGTTDWQDEVLRTAITTQHNLSFGGGSNGDSYRFSAGILDQDGIINNSGIKRYSASFNGNKKVINDRLNIGTQLNLANTVDAGVPVTDNSGFSGDLLAAMLKSNPTNSVRSSDGTFNQVSTVEPNPAAIIAYSKDNTNTIRALGNLNAELQIVDGLKFKTVVGFDRSISSRKAAFSPLLKAAQIENVGQVYFTDIETNNSLWENYFTYDKEFGNVSFNGLAGYSYQRFEYFAKSSNATNFRVDDLDLMVNNVSSADNADGFGSIINGSNSNVDELQSYFGRINLGFSSKYLLTATVRADGSTRFGSGNKYGVFPSFAGKWRLIEEDFVPKNVFSDLGLRLGYGITGNQELPHNLYQERRRYGSAGINNSSSINNGGFGTVAFANPGLKWESTTQFNAGLDFGFAGGRLSGSLDYYYKNTNDLLFQVFSAQPAPSPFVWRNLDADVINRGLEISLNAIVVDANDFEFEINANAAFNKNVVENLLGVYDTGAINGQGLTGAFAQRIASGQPLFAYFLREFGGYDEAGNSIYPNGDFQQFLDGASPNPTVTGGLTTNFKYKSLTLSAFFNGVFGNYLYSNNANAFFTKGSFSNGRNVTRDVVGSDEGPLNAPDVSTRFLEKGDFVRLANLNLGYTVNTGKTDAISSLRFFLTGQNLALFTNYSGQDPEVNTNKQINGIPSFGIDYTAYPRARTWTLGANISF